MPESSASSGARSPPATSEKSRAAAERIFGWVSEGKLSPQVQDVLPFTRASEALTRLEKRQVQGKLVLVP